MIQSMCFDNQHSSYFINDFFDIFSNIDISRETQRNIIFFCETARTSDVTLPDQNVVDAIEDVDQSGDAHEQLFVFDPLDKGSAGARREPGMLPKITAEIDDSASFQLQASKYSLAGAAKARQHLAAQANRLVGI